jgi:hypothetical protein
VRLNKWESVVRPHFDFLASNGFTRATQFDSTGFWETSIAYASTSHAVRVSYSVESRRAEVHLVRLRDGALPEPMIFYEDAAPFDNTLLDNVVLARAPVRAAEMKRTGLKKDDLAAQLDTWATLLREVAEDFLAGGDAVFDEAKAVVSERTAEEGQQIVVWLPEDADVQAEVEAVTSARSTAPQNVDVVVRRYRR